MVIGIDLMFCAIKSWALDWTKSLIVLLGDLVSRGGDEVIRRHGDERRVGRLVRRMLRSGWRDAMLVDGEQGGERRREEERGEKSEWAVVSRHVKDTLEGL